MMLRNAPISRGSGCSMAVKVVILFLAGMAVLAMFGRLRYPGKQQLESRKCPKCGRYRIGRGPCACGHIKKG